MSVSNLEFSLTFSETNLRWLLGEEPPDPAKIEKCKQEIERIKKLLQLAQSTEKQHT